jgi:hypothetical protein
MADDTGSMLNALVKVEREELAQYCADISVDGTIAQTVSLTLRKGQTLWVSRGSLLAYTVGIFWYEVGYFLPLVVLAYSGWFARRRLASVAWFALPAGLYAASRLTLGFGLGAAEASLHQFGLSSLFRMPQNLFDLAHHYAGRYMIRSTLYGLAQWWAMDRAWLAVAVAADALLLWLLARWVGRLWPAPQERRIGWLGLALFAGFVLPILLNERVGVGGRHLALPSVGLALWLVVLLGRLQARAWRPALVAALAAGLLVSQGNAWAQVVACRINGAVYGVLRERRDELRAAHRLIIDTRSFADRIPHTWVVRPFNVLNTYYGAQAFEEWGLRSMALLATGGMAGSIEIATESPRATADGQLEFAISEASGYRSVGVRRKAVPREGTVVIDYTAVYGDGFDQGRPGTAPGGRAG